MSLTAMVATAPKGPALVVSKDAVLVRPDGATVWVAIRKKTSEDMEAHPVPVIVHTRMRNEYAVEPETVKGREFLLPGVQVVIEGAEHLQSGQNVRIATLTGDVFGDASGGDGPKSVGAPKQDTDGETSGRER